MEDPSLATHGETRWTGLSLALLLLAVALVIAGGAAFWFATVDDAFIYYRCAEHLAAGHGPLFNPGERVETYSSPLWMAMLAGAARLGADPEPVSKVLGVLSALALVVLVATAARRSAVRPTIAAAAAFAMACVPSAHYYSASGLETSFYALAVALLALLPAIELAPRPSNALLAFGVFAVVTGRPEGMLVAALGSIACLRARRGSRLGLALGWAASLGVSTARLGYFHTLLPSPFLAKPTPWRLALEEGGASVAHAIAHQGYLLLAALFALGGGVVALLALHGGRVRRGEAAVVTAVAALAAGMSFVLYAPKDWMPGARFALPYAAPLFFLAALGGEAIARNWSARKAPRARAGIVAAAIAVAAVFAFGLAASLSTRRDCRRGYLNPALVGTRYVAMGSWLRAHAHPGDRVLAYEIGAIGRASGLEIVDHEGLATPQLAGIIQRAGGYTRVRLGRDEEAMRQVARACVALRPDWFFVRVREDASAQCVLDASLPPSAAVEPIQRLLVEQLGTDFKVAKIFPLREDGSGERYALLRRGESDLDQPR